MAENHARKIQGSAAIYAWLGAGKVSGRIQCLHHSAEHFVCNLASNPDFRPPFHFEWYGHEAFAQDSLPSHCSKV
jgi:hypothetical protein